MTRPTKFGNDFMNITNIAALRFSWLLAIVVLGHPLTNGDGIFILVNQNPTLMYYLTFWK